MENGNGRAHQWGVGDSQKVAGLKVGRATVAEDLSPRRGKMFFGKKKVRLGQHFDENMACKSRWAVTADQVNSEQLRLVRQSDAIGAVVTEVETPA